MVLDLAVILKEILLHYLDQWNCKKRLAVILTKLFFLLFPFFLGAFSVEAVTTLPLSLVKIVGDMNNRHYH